MAKRKYSSKKPYKKVYKRQPSEAEIKRNRTRRVLRVILVIVALALYVAIENGFFDKFLGHEKDNTISLDDIPEYSGEPYVVINGNVPEFSDEEIVTESYEFYSPLDGLGRCGTAMACIGKDLMPTGERQQISSIHPTGWHSNRYDFVDQEMLFNRCHLIAFQLAGEDLNDRNLITGTRYLNTIGMLPFEEEVGYYVRRTGNHVMYRVSPIFKGNELVARGVHMEALSVEDGGKGICFNVYCYNVQPRIEIDYATGDNWEVEVEEDLDDAA
ncbi:MAG: DNA/RNA non-specific endonuclease [Mogibacterium sp.]|nr:DNA/RNA non-specific endonuclease [Mogibacterium sp.]